MKMPLPGATRQTHIMELNTVYVQFLTASYVVSYFSAIVIKELGVNSSVLAIPFITCKLPGFQRQPAANINGQIYLMFYQVLSEQLP